jgi:sulfite exporter TauE/SafE/copper chaperone CopZ
MHCRSCEMLVEEKLKEEPGIKNVQVSFKQKEARIYSHHPLDMGNIQRLVSEAGYEVKADDSKFWINLDPKTYLDLGKSLVILLVLYFLAKKIGLFDISTSAADKPSNLLFVLLIGLTAGVSTCMALVGGLVLSISARHSEKHPEASAIQKFRPHLYFNFGRILSFFVFGGLIGLLGKTFLISGSVLGLMIIAVGLVMLILGLQLTEISPKLSRISVTLPSGIGKLLGIKRRHEKEYSHLNSILVGALTFFLPCGFTQAMQLYAISTASFWTGGLIMAIFAIGTAPGLLGIGGLTSVLKGNFAKQFFKFTGLLVIILSIFNIANGYRLTGFNIFPLDDDPGVTVVDDPNVKIENGVQIVRMTQNSNGYSPNKFTVKNNIPVKWVIDSKDSNSCSSSIFMPKKNIKKFLNPGANTIEFTPTETGEIKFSCSMGMYSGKFNVTN